MIADVKRIYSELGHVPNAIEIQTHSNFSDRKIRAIFGGYTTLLQAAGLLSEKHQRTDTKFKYIQRKIESFDKRIVDLKTLFKKAGNPKSLKTIVFTDVHWKNRDPGAWSVLMKFLTFYQPHVVGNLGDFLDCGALSHWPSETTEPRVFVPEARSARLGLLEVKERTPHAVWRFYCEGNHEDWINQAIAAKMPELFHELDDLGLDITLERILDLPGAGFELFPLNTILKIGHAHFTHGLYTPKHHAAKHLEELKCNIYYGHLHDCQGHDAISMDGPLEARSIACLCRLDAPFMKGKPNKWSHGLSVFEFFPDGTYTAYFPKIIQGRMAFNGKVFEA